METLTGADLMGAQDDCLIAITDGRPIPSATLRSLPPWRAVLIARVAERAGGTLEEGNLHQLVAEARAAGGEGTLGEWWARTGDATST